MGWGGARPGAGRRKASGGALPDKPTVPAEVKKPFHLDFGSVERIIEQSKAYARTTSHDQKFNPFQLPAFPPGVVPKDDKLKMAMDSAMEWGSNQWAGAVLNSITAEGMLFMGYPYLAELAQRPEYRIIAETIADDATRKWIDFEVTGDEAENKRKAEKDPEGEDERMADPDERKKRVKAAGKTDKVKELKDDQLRLEVQSRFYDNLRNDGFFGRSHLYLNFGDDLDSNETELVTPIGDGREAASTGKIKKGSFKYLRTIEPVWTYPTTYNAQNPLREDWYNPQVWFVMGKQIHCTRLLTFIGHPVPDMLKPAYAFGGLSLSQMAKPYVDIWLTTRESVAALIHSFSVMVLSTDLQTLTAPGNATNLLARAAMFNALRDNQGLMIVNKNTEEFSNVSASLAGLHELQSQAQEHMASVSRIPLVKFTGIQPAGLNASSEGEIKVYDDTISAYQNRLIFPKLTRIINFEQLSLWGEIDPEITFVFQPLREITEKERGDKQKADGERDQIYVDMGAIAPAEVRKRIVDDPELPYTALDPDDLPDLKEEEETGLEPEGGRPNPLAGGGPDGGEGKEAGGKDAAIFPFAEGVDRQAVDAGWNEGDHPRAPDGKFGAGGSSGKGGGEKQHFQAPQFGLNNPAHFSFSAWKQSLRPKPKSSGDPDSPEGVVVFGMGGKAPAELNGKKFEEWTPPEDMDWNDVDGQADVEEPELPDIPEGMELSSGLIIREPDGRIWLMRPKNGYGGYEQTFPKGRAEAGMSLQANAIKEGWEETGLKARVTDFAGDYQGDTTVTRFYFAERETGDPTKASWEAEGVVLSPPGKLGEFLNRKRDKEIAANVTGSHEGKEPTEVEPDVWAWDEANFEESKHPRDKGGKFATTAGGGAGASKLASSKASTSKAHDPIAKSKPLSLGKMDKVGPQMGSNPGGVYQAPTGEKYYIKSAKTKAHAQNELLAAKLFALTGSPTLKYQPVEGGDAIATELQKLDKNNVSQLSPEEKKQAQADFATHAWLANYDAAGTGGDNIGVISGKVTPLDFGGALEYRAQGKPKGDAFGDKVTELKTMLDPSISPDAAKLYGDMTPEEMKASAQKVVNISDQEIYDAVTSVVGPGEKAGGIIGKLILRKNDIAKTFNVEFESKHARGAGGKFIKMAGAEEPNEQYVDEIINGEGELVANYGEPEDDEIASIYKTPQGYLVIGGLEGEHDAIVMPTLVGAMAQAEAFTGKKAKPSAAPELKTEAPKTFSSKKEHVAHLLQQGTTAAEILKATGWPSVSVPQQAKAANLKLEKYKEGGVTKYKGTPMTKEEIAAAKGEAKAKQQTAAAPKPEFAPESPGSKHSTFPSPSVVTHKGLATPPTEAEIAKAKKTAPLKLQYVPGAPQGSAEAQKLVDKFNEKYANKAVSSKAEIENKISDFKEMQAAMVPLMNAEQQKAAKAAAEQQAKAAEAAQEQAKKAEAEKKQKEKEAKEAAAKNAETMSELGISEVEAMGFNALVKMMGGSQKDLTTAFKKYEDQAKSFGYPINGFQCALIKNYTDGGYGSINSALRSGSWSAAQHVYVKMVNSALQKMPTYEGMTKRGTDLSKDVQALYIAGNVVEERAFTSSSPSSPWGGNTKFTIKAIGKRGAHVKKLSSHSSEDEVVFSAHTFFHVDKVEGTPGGQMHVYMTEVEGAA